MAEKKKSKKSDNLIVSTYKRIFLPLVAAALSTLVMVFCVLTLLEVQKNGYGKAPNYLMWVFIFLALTNIVAFIKERTKINFVKCLVLLLFDVALGVVVLFGKNNPYLFSLVAGLYCLGLLAKRIVVMIQKRNIRSFVFNGIIGITVLLLAIGLFIPASKPEDIEVIILLECIILAIASFFEVFAIAVSQLKLKTLGMIILKTYALEILFGLAAIMVCFSLVFMYNEPTITTFGDGMWYCFAVVTTIGFGDYTCTTLVGRLLTALLGVYGIIVVAVITSIFVNFYNETSGKKDIKEIKDIKKDE